MASIRESFNTEQADRLLMENNFLDENDLWDVIQYADDSAFEYIYANRKKYATNIQYLIEPEDRIPPRIKVVVRDMTDKDIKDDAAARISAKKREFEDLWMDIEESIGDRPYGDIDQEYDDSWEKLQDVRQRMTTYLSKKSGKYVAPSSRSKSDDALDKLEKEMDACKQTYHAIEKRIEEADKKYLAEKKDEYYQRWLLSV